jgi:hypothetical protein
LEARERRADDGRSPASVLDAFAQAPLAYREWLARRPRPRRGAGADQ